MQNNQQSSFPWPILVLITFTGTFVAAMPVSCMPVLFEEISIDLNLNLVQLGTIWGISSLAGIFVSIIGGVISDRFGVKLIIGVFSLLVGITGALRGLSNSFFMLTALMFINGIARLIMSVTMNKIMGLLFKGPKLGTAMGIMDMGIGFGLLLGPLISATFVSPMIGGWRNVMYVYGAVSVLFGVIWLVIKLGPSGENTRLEATEHFSFKQSFYKLIKLKALWLLGLCMLFRLGATLGVAGYLPLYLRDRGWSIAAADGSLSIFYAVSTALVVPISVLSDKIGSRKALILPALFVNILTTALIPVVSDGMIWVLVILSGAFIDGFMAIIVTMLLETEGIGAKYSGMAVGILFTIAQVGSLVSPPLGNGFASISSGLPFYFWAGLAALSFIFFIFVHETGHKKKKEAGILLQLDK